MHVVPRLDLLPPEIFLEVAQYLPLPERGALRASSRACRDRLSGDAFNLPMLEAFKKRIGRWVGKSPPYPPHRNAGTPWR